MAPSARTVTVAALQLDLSSSDEAANIAAVSALIEDAAGKGAQIVLPPELFSGPYFCKVEDEAHFALARPTAEHPSVTAMQALAAKHTNFSFGIASTIFATNMEDAENILAWARTKNLDVVFNMLRFTDAMLHNKELQETIGFRPREEEFMRKFFLDRVHEESILSGQSFMYLHYADMIANGYHRTMPCPFQRQGLLLNPNGDLHYCENSQKLGNVLDESAESLYFRAENLKHREQVKTETCPTCLSPCQVNVGAMKQFIPYAKFLKRAYDVKRAPERHLETLPAAEQVR